MANLSLTRILNPSPGWYRGDFHAHTTFSDGRYSAPELAALARKAGLDFLSVTDHNAIGSFSEFGEDPGPGLLVIPGIEVTFHEGHWNAFGLPGREEWMRGIISKLISIPTPEGRTTSEIMAQIAALGHLNSINHPLLKPWQWQDNQTLMRQVDCLEVWNDLLWPDNEQANRETVDFWSTLLNCGYRITALGGTDFHFLPGDTSYPGELFNMPDTYVYAENLSVAAILDAVRKRRAYVSRGPQVRFQAQVGGAIYGIGADLGPQAGEIAFVATALNYPGQASLRVVKNGRTLSESPVENLPAELHAGEPLDPSQPAWYRLDVFDPSGNRLAFTNPIFTGPQPEIKLEKFEDLYLQYQIDANR